MSKTKPKSKQRTPSEEHKQKPSLSRARVGMGIDPSVTCLGLVVVREGKLLRKRRYKTVPHNMQRVGLTAQSGLLPSGIFRGDDQERIEWLVKKILYNFRKFQPDLILMEGYAFGAKGRGLTILHELGGVIKHELHKAEAPWSLVTPTALKSYATGIGNCSKQEMIEAAKVKLEADFGISRRSDKTISISDEADAFWLGMMALEDYDSIISEEEMNACDERLNTSNNS